jgi:AhpC/TSA family protein
MLLGYVLLFLVAGCGRSSGAAKGESPAAGQLTSPKREAAFSAKPTAEWTANEILQQLLTTYRQAKAYRDSGVVRLAFRRGGQPIAEDAPVSVTFERPGKLSIVAYQATVKCDGKELRARINEPPNNLDGQVVVRPAPRSLTLSDLAGDELLYETLCSRLRRQPIQLELLLENSGLVSALGADVACERLSDASHQGYSCFRVQVPSPGGPFVFWVDQVGGLLRRLDYPALALAPEFIARDPEVTNLELYADLRGANLDQSIPASQFTLEVPSGAKRMQRFARPPQPLPSNLFGKKPPEFFFTRSNGGKLSDRDCAGKITVLAWYHDNPACQATLQQVSAAAERLQGDNDAIILAVATDPHSTSNELLERRLREWGVRLPLVRDLQAFGDQAFHIEQQPAIVILDQRGVVQIFQLGGSPELADQIVSIVERLKRGDDLAGEIIAQHERDQQSYQALLARGGPEPREIVDLPEAVIRRRSEPSKLRLAPLWENHDINNPGNFVIAEEPSHAPRIYMFAGPRTVAEISAEGKVLRRSPLDIPEAAAVTFARTAIDAQGQRYFVASAPLAPMLFVFDAEWRLRFAFPPADQPPLDVLDLTLVDLDLPSDAPEIITASASQGVIALSLDGSVRWRNTAVRGATSAAAIPANEANPSAILVAGAEGGGITREDAAGHEHTPIKVGNWPVGRVLASRPITDKPTALLALSQNAKLEPFAVGLTDKLQELWNYPLPPGVHLLPIEPITFSRALDPQNGEWWIAGPDGSIHVITADGRFFDSFYFGAPLTGLSAARIDDRAVLLVSTATGLSAWQVGLPPTPKKSREY